MPDLRERGEALVRHMRAIGPWRSIVGLAGLATSYAMIGQSLSGRPSALFDAYGEFVALLIPMITFIFFVAGTIGAAADRGRTIAFSHFSVVVTLLFMLWGLDLIPVVRPQTARDFQHLFPPLAGLLFSTLVLTAGRENAEEKPAAEPEAA
ncbi:MAG: hypothetical protein ACTHJR_15860 [Sphingomonas sp.]|uniref:hypothetical protein n=1 Tax=Sphingomonas sp. TaxID=28214 RepID=UPI003F7CE23F